MTSPELDVRRIGTTNEHRYAFVCPRPVAPGEQRGEGRRATRFGRHPQHLPKCGLRVADLVVRHQHHLRVDELPGDREHQLPDRARREAVHGNSTRRCIDRPAGRKRVRERRRSVRFNGDDAHLAAIPGRDSTDQPAAADSDQQCLDLRCVRFQLQPDAALAEQGLSLVVGMDRKCPGLGDPALARGQCVGVAIAPDHKLGAIGPDPRDLGRRRHGRDENRRVRAEPFGRERDRRPVIAARRRDHPRRRNDAADQVCESAARLERTRVLQLFQLEQDRLAPEAEILGNR